MAQTDAQRRAVNKYHAKFDELKLRIPLGEAAIFRSHAASKGESLNSFLYRAARETMARDRDSSDE